MQSRPIRGFTLIELVVVIGIIVLAAGFITPTLTVNRQEVDEIVDIITDGITYVEEELGY